MKFLYCGRGNLVASLGPDGPALFELTVPHRHRRSARQVPAIPAFERAYREMADAVASVRVPRLKFYDDLHDMGGLFVAADWVICLGIADMYRIADGVIASNRLLVEREVRKMATRAGVPTPDLRNVVFGAAAGRCLGHELGHALLSLGYSNPYDPDEEAGADYYAGKFDSVRGKSPELGAAFFAEIGCTGSRCTHPAPLKRAQAYLRGHRDQSRNA